MDSSDFRRRRSEIIRLQSAYLPVHAEELVRSSIHQKLDGAEMWSEVLLEIPHVRHNSGRHGTVVLVAVRLLNETRNLEDGWDVREPPWPCNDGERLIDISVRVTNRQEVNVDGLKDAHLDEELQVCHRVLVLDLLDRTVKKINKDALRTCQGRHSLVSLQVESFRSIRRTQAAAQVVVEYGDHPD